MLIKGLYSIIDFKNEDGETALHRAVSCGKLSTVVQSISCGACQDIKNDDGDTPIDLATERQDLDILRALRRPTEDS